MMQCYCEGIIKCFFDLSVVREQRKIDFLKAISHIFTHKQYLTPQSVALICGDGMLFCFDHVIILVRLDLLYIIDLLKNLDGVALRLYYYWSDFESF